MIFAIVQLSKSPYGIHRAGNCTWCLESDASCHAWALHKELDTSIKISSPLNAIISKLGVSLTTRES